MATTAPHTTVAVVTGGSSGIGRHAAIRLAGRGSGVILTSNTNPAGAAETVATIERAGGSAVVLPLDIGRSDTFAAFAAQVVAVARERWDRETVDHLVNNAGFGASAPFAETPEELLDRVHRVILRGPYFLTQALLPVLADGGAIVNVTSLSGRPSGVETDYSAYGSAKAGLSVLTRCMAKELAPRGIRVNAVAPGPTRTRIADDAFERYPEVIAPLVERTALGRLGTGDDVGRVVAALCSDDLAWITGDELDVSGGFGL